MLKKSITFTDFNGDERTEDFYFHLSESNMMELSVTYKDGIAWGNAWVVPKGTAHKELAMKLINYAISEAAQMRLLPVGTYGPVLVSVAVILRSGGTSLEPGRGLFTKQRSISAAAATEPTA